MLNLRSWHLKRSTYVKRRRAQRMYNLFLGRDVNTKIPKEETTQTFHALCIKLSASRQQTSMLGIPLTLVSCASQQQWACWKSLSLRDVAAQLLCKCCGQWGEKLLRLWFFAGKCLSLSVHSAAVQQRQANGTNELKQVRRFHCCVKATYLGEHQKAKRQSLALQCSGSLPVHPHHWKVAGLQSRMIFASSLTFLLGEDERREPC